MPNIKKIKSRLVEQSLLEQGILDKATNSLRGVLLNFTSGIKNIFNSIFNRIRSQSTSSNVVEIFTTSETRKLIDYLRSQINSANNITEEDKRELPPDRQFSVDMGFLLEYAIVYGVAAKLRVPVLKRDKSERSGGVYKLINEDTYKIRDVTKLVKTASAFKTIRALRKIYMDKKDDLARRIRYANEVDRALFLKTFGESKYSGVRPILKSLVNDMMNSIDSTKMIIGVIHAGEYTSALFKADFSFILRNKRGRHEISHVSLKLYNERAEFIKILGARPYVFHYLNKHDMLDKGYTSRAGVELWKAEHGTRTIERDGKMIETGKVDFESTKATLDEFVGNIKEANFSIKKVLNLFKTIMHGQEKSTFAGFKKSENVGFVKVLPHLEMIDPRLVDTMVIRQWGEGYAIQASYYDKEGIYYKDNIIILTPTKENKIEIQVKVIDTDQVINESVIGRYMRPRLKPYMQRAEEGASALNKNSLLKRKIKADTVFFVFDTETTGLNYLGNDVIHELAVIAYDRNFKYIDEYHATAPVPQKKEPINIFQNAKKRLVKSLPSMEPIVDKFARAVFKNYLQIVRNVDRGKYKSKNEIIYNVLKKMVERYGLMADDKKLKSLMYIIMDLINSADIQEILRFTQYGKINAQNTEKDQGEIAKGTFAFVKRIVEQTGTTHPVAVAHNYPFDLMMLRQAATDARIPYNFTYFIDTAVLSKKVASKYILAFFIYYYDMWKKTGDEKLKKFLIRMKPAGNDRMGTLADFLSIPNLNWHTAKNDVEATANILKYILVIDAAARDFFASKQDVDNIFKKLEKMGESVKNWFHAQTNPYKNYHRKMYSSFLKEINQPEEEVIDSKEKLKKDVDKKYDDLIKKELPGTGKGKKRDNVTKRGPKYDVWKRGEVI